MTTSAKNAKNAKSLIKDAALELIKKNGGTTTLETKNLLRATVPGSWTQREISQAMIEMERNGELILYADNGTFRTYTVLGFVTNPDIKTVSLTGLAKIVEENVGNKITVAHVKKSTGDLNIMNCTVLPDKNSLGAFKVIEDGQMKTFYPTSLLEVTVNNTIYRLK